LRKSSEAERAGHVREMGILHRRASWIHPIFLCYPDATSGSGVAGSAAGRC
jgi:hypothetical protein